MKEITLSFEQLEQEVYKANMDRCKEEFVSILLELDEYLSSIIDTSLFHFKGKNERNIKTLFGAVCFCRCAYEVGLRNGEKETVYLLDELLNIETIGRLSHAVARRACELREQGNSYKRIAVTLQEENDIAITRQALHRIVNEYTREKTASDI